MKYPIIDLNHKLGHITGGTFSITNKMYTNQRFMLPKQFMDYISPKDNSPIAVSSYNNNVSIPRLRCITGNEIFTNTRTITYGDVLVHPAVLVRIVYNTGSYYVKLVPLNKVMDNPTGDDPLLKIEVIKDDDSLSKCFKLNGSGLETITTQQWNNYSINAEFCYDICYEYSIGYFDYKNLRFDLVGVVLAFQVALINSNLAANVYIGVDTSSGAKDLRVFVMPESLDTQNNQSKSVDPLFIDYKCTYENVKGVEDIYTRTLTIEGKANQALDKAEKAESAVEDIGGALEGSYISG